MVICPRCEGKGSGFSIMCGPKGCRTGDRKCSTCSGDGSITEDHANRIKVGETMRQDRIKRNATIREDATRLGCDFGEWSRIEFGRAPETDSGLSAYSKRVGELNDAGAWTDASRRPSGDSQ